MSQTVVYEFDAWTVSLDRWYLEAERLSGLGWDIFQVTQNKSATRLFGRRPKVVSNA